MILSFFKSGFFLAGSFLKGSYFAKHMFRQWLQLIQKGTFPLKISGDSGFEQDLDELTA